MSDEKILPKGIRFFQKHEKAPEFVLGTLIISLNELVQFCKDNPSLLSEYNGQKQLKLQVKKSKGGNLYADIDTYKPGQSAPEPSPTANKEQPGDDLPF